MRWKEFLKHAVSDMDIIIPVTIIWTITVLAAVGFILLAIYATI